MASMEIIIVCFLAVAVILLLLICITFFVKMVHKPAEKKEEPKPEEAKPIPVPVAAPAKKITPLSFDDSYLLLSADQKERVDGILAYALSKPGTKLYKDPDYRAVMVGSQLLLKLSINEDGIPLGLSYKPEEGFRLVEITVRIVDDTSLALAKKILDSAENNLKETKEPDRK
jgi:Na+-transporting methylmalonyl-CoA/oxaloacetate decarboxylase gamma subunit